MLEKLWKGINAVVYWPMRQIHNKWLRHLSTWVAHGTITALLARGGHIVSGGDPWVAWAGFALGGTFYAARETLRSWPLKEGEVDHFGDVLGPILIGSAMLVAIIS